MKASFVIIPAWLVLGAVLALGHRGHAQALATNSTPFGTNGAASIASVGRDTPFATAIVDHPGAKLPEQGPWTLSESDITSDLKETLCLVQDLVEHDKRLAENFDPRFLLLWDLLSSETRSALKNEWATLPGRNYTAPGLGIESLVTNLNLLIQGKLIYDEKTFTPLKPYLSGDTVKLLNQPAGADMARLNRLLLEELLPQDIVRRPKILFDPYSREYLFVDFAEQTVSLYTQDGKKQWTADLGPSIAGESRQFPYFRNPGIPTSYRNVGLWDVSPQSSELLVRVFARHFYSIDLNTGKVSALPHT